MARGRSSRRSPCGRSDPGDASLEHQRVLEAAVIPDDCADRLDPGAVGTRDRQSRQGGPAVTICRRIAVATMLLVALSVFNGCGGSSGVSSLAGAQLQLPA